MLRVSGIVEESIVDGPGVRFVVFAQGCVHRCKGCHNPQTFDLHGGYLVSVDDVFDSILKNSLITGVTFSGGEPFLQSEEFSVLAKKVHSINLSVLVYTGYIFENLLAGGKDSSKDRVNLLNSTDILVDGPFKIEEKSLLLKFKGSKNQRIIDVKKSLDEGKTVVIG